MSTPNGSATLVVTFVDWPNIEKGLRNRFSGLGLPENVASLAVPAIGAIAGRLGSLEYANVYADWRGKYATVVPVIEQDYRFRHTLVSRKASGGDRCDTTIVADMIDLTHERVTTPIPTILLCAGDADYTVAVRRALGRGFEVYVSSETSSLSPELGSLATALYPFERYFIDEARKAQIELTSNIKPEDLPGLDVIRRWSAFVRLLDRLSQTLPYVTLPYFARRLVETRPQFGATWREAYGSIETSIEMGMTRIPRSVQDPSKSGNDVRIIELVSDNTLVRCVMENIKVPDDGSPDTPIRLG